jgi:hypothetical protein
MVVGKWKDEPAREATMLLLRKGGKDLRMVEGNLTAELDRSPTVMLLSRELDSARLSLFQS